MGTTLRAKIASLPADRQARIKTRAEELACEEMTLAELRKAHRKTQVAVARRLKIEQGAVSRMEQRDDMLLSTLRSYVRAIGGDLDLVARLPGRPPVYLSGFGDLEQDRGRSAHRSILTTGDKARRTRGKADPDLAKAVG
jgi:transcriptional regulator with XRE-family HTH domain